MQVALRGDERQKIYSLVYRKRRPPEGPSEGDGYERNCTVR